MCVQVKRGRKRRRGYPHTAPQSLALTRNGYGFARLCANSGALTWHKWYSIARLWGRNSAFRCEGTLDLGSRSQCAIVLETRRRLFMARRWLGLAAVATLVLMATVYLDTPLMLAPVLN